MLKPRSAQQGFSIVELMIGLTLGLAIMATLSYLLVNNSTARAELDKSMQQIENGRYAMDLLKSELRLAGYFGPAYTLGSVPAALPAPCATDVTTLAAALPLAIQGYSQPTTNHLSGCGLVNANIVLSGVANDILVVRRVQTKTYTIAQAVDSSTGNPNALYFQANGQKSVLNFPGADPAVTFDLTDKAGTAPLQQFMTHIYFVSPCDVPASGTTCGSDADGGTPIPTLKRLELAFTNSECLSGTAPCWKLVPLVQGVERFHVEYGVDNDTDGTPDTYVKQPASTTEWANVVIVRVHVLARNTRPTVGHQDNKSYKLGELDPISGGNDQYKRHVFTGTVRLMNISGRREA